MTVRRRRRMGRWLLAASSSTMIGAGVVALTTAASAPPASAVPSPGQGNSYAQSLQVAPHDGSLAVGVTLGEALAGHTGTYARAQSQGIDLGAIGTALTGYNCGSQSFKPNQIPQPFEAEAGSPQAANGESQSATNGGYGSDEYVVARTTPYGEADTKFVDQINTGLIALSGLASKSWSGIVDGQREAGATSDIGSLSLLGGLVQLNGLHWEAVYPSGGGTAQPTGSFSVGSASHTVTGLLAKVTAPIPVNQGEAALEKAVNQILNTFGMQLQLPAVTNSGGIISVSPLQLEIIPNTLRDTVLQKILQAVEPALIPLELDLENGFPGNWEPQQLAAALCQSDTPLTVGDITIASLTGAGFFSASFGGVDASSSDLPPNSFNLSLPGGFLSLPPTIKTIGGSVGTGTFTPGTPGTPATPGRPAIPAASGVSSTPPLPQTSAPLATSPPATTAPASPVQNTSAISYAAGGPLLAVGLGGLGLLALLAEGDRRMMRRAQHTVSFEE